MTSNEYLRAKEVGQKLSLPQLAQNKRHRLSSGRRSASRRSLRLSRQSRRSDDRVRRLRHVAARHLLRRLPRTAPSPPRPRLSAMRQGATGREWREEVFPLSLHGKTETACSEKASAFEANSSGLQACQSHGTRGSGGCITIFDGGRVYFLGHHNIIITSSSSLLL